MKKYWFMFKVFDFLKDTGLKCVNFLKLFNHLIESKNGCFKAS